MQYLNFCKRFDHYINLKPVFKNSNKNSLWSRQTKNLFFKHGKRNKLDYPVMFLNDIEIHWIHEKDTKECLDKYNRRLERYKTKKLKPIFCWIETEFFNIHNNKRHKEIIDNFVTINNSIFIGSRYYIPPIKSCNNRIYYNILTRYSKQRTINNVLKVNNQKESSSMFIKILKSRFNIKPQIKNLI